jgi:hypothetical protein
VTAESEQVEQIGDADVAQLAHERHGRSSVPGCRAFSIAPDRDQIYVAGRPPSSPRWSRSHRRPVPDPAQARTGRPIAANVAQGPWTAPDGSSPAK